MFDLEKACRTEALEIALAISVGFRLDSGLVSTPRENGQGRIPLLGWRRLRVQSENLLENRGGADWSESVPVVVAVPVLPGARTRGSGVFLNETRVVIRNPDWMYRPRRRAPSAARSTTSPVIIRCLVDCAGRPLSPSSPSAIPRYKANGPCSNDSEVFI
jgi:hypothetical protein